MSFARRINKRDSRPLVAASLLSAVIYSMLLIFCISTLSAQAVEPFEPSIQVTEDTGGEHFYQSALSEGSNWLDTVNFYRATAYLPPVTENTGWSYGDWLHSRYMVKNQWMGHSEDPSNPWYTPEGALAAQNSNVMLVPPRGTSLTQRESIEAWMTGPFHAVGIIDPRLQSSGFGIYSEDVGGLLRGAASLDVLRGAGGIPGSVSYPVKWPGNGATVPVTSYSGNETPGPDTHCPGYQGLPIILQVNPNPSFTPSVTSHSFSNKGVQLEHCVFDETSYWNPNSDTQTKGRNILGYRNAVVLMPKNELVPGETYNVSITTNGQNHSWSFSIDGSSVSPFGTIDSVYVDQNGQLVSSGYAIDPETQDPIDVHIYINGKHPANVVRASEYREDVANKYPQSGGNHGFTLTTSLLADTNEVCAYGINVGAGSNTLIGCKTITGSWNAYPDSDPPPGLHYYWTWYDNLSSSDWVLLTSPRGEIQQSFDLNIARKSPTLAPFGGPDITGGNSIAAIYDGLVGGPVVATSLNGTRAITSQRILWPKGGFSLEEVVGVEESRLSDQYYWTWYDQLSAGYTNWVLIANPSTTETVRAEIFIKGQKMTNQLDPARSDYGTTYFNIGPGANVFPTFRGIMGGPVEVRAYTPGGSWDNVPDRRKVMASQRVLSNYGTAINEAPGVPAEELADDYYWTLYDDFYGSNWIILANPNSTSTGFTIDIGGGCNNPGGPGPNQVCERGSLAPAGDPGDIVTPRFGGINGPVRVTSTGGPIIASQRVIFGPSFGETMGYPADSLSDSYHWTWYDQVSAGMVNWVLIANNNDSPIYYEISIPGVDTNNHPGARGTIGAGKNVTPTFPFKMGGPVQVQAWTDASKSAPANVMASQRILYNGYFNEVVGSALQ